MKRHAWTFGLGLAAMVAMTSPGHGQTVVTADLEQAYLTSPGWEDVDVIVEFDRADVRSVVKAFIASNQKFRFRNARTWRRLLRRRIISKLKRKAASDQLPLREWLSELGVENARSLWAANGLAVRLPSHLIPGLAERPGVKRLRLDRKIKMPKADPDVVPGGSPEGDAVAGWNIDRIGAPALWDLGHDGGGVVVAVMDTGADLNHPDLSPRFRGGDNSWFDPNGEHAAPYDGDGHGTRVLGLIVAGDASGAPLGVAPGAEWIAVKIFDDNGEAALSDIHSGFQWLLDPDGDPATDDAPDVVNNSWFLDPADTCDQEFAADTEAMRAAGIAVVYAAGNTGPVAPSSASPGNNPGGFSVGSIDMLETVSSFSARGPSACDETLFPRVVAPGERVVTTDRTPGFPLPLTTTVSGTSFAAPHVTGAVALLQGAFTELSVVELETAIEESAVDLGPEGHDDTYGTGLIDVALAYDAIAASNLADADGDGFEEDVDCNDSDPAVYPDAPEIKFDGVDQDCNGYDLTIDMATRYVSRRFRDRLVVLATSELDGEAQLEAVVETASGDFVTLPMRWLRRRDRWKVVARNFKLQFGSAPVAVEVRGVEGSETSEIVCRLFWCERPWSLE